MFVVSKSQPACALGAEYIAYFIKYTFNGESRQQARERCWGWLAVSFELLPEIGRGPRKPDAEGGSCHE